MSLWLIGATLAVLGSCVTNAGVNIQKYSFIENDRKPKHLQKPYTSQPYYYIGLAGVVLGSLGDFAALAFAAQSIVAPIGSVTLVTNVLFAHFLLKEPLSKRDIMFSSLLLIFNPSMYYLYSGTIIIITGCTLSVAFGNHSDSSYTLSELRELFGGTVFLIYVALIAVLCVILYVVIKYVEPIKHSLQFEIKRYGDAVERGDDVVALDADTQILSLTARYKPYIKIHPFCYCALSGILGAQSILFGKMVSELLKTSIMGDNQLIEWLFYIFLLSMVFFIFTQLHFMALGLSLFDALYVVPVFQCFFITGSTLGGACFFREFNSFRTDQAIVFPIGVCITLYGVYALSSRTKNQAEESELRRCSITQRQVLVSRVSARSRIPQVDGVDMEASKGDNLEKVDLTRCDTDGMNADSSEISGGDTETHMESSSQIRKDNAWATVPKTPSHLPKKNIKHNKSSMNKASVAPYDGNITDDGRPIDIHVQTNNYHRTSAHNTPLSPTNEDASFLMSAPNVHLSTSPNSLIRRTLMRPTSINSNMRRNSKKGESYLALPNAMNGDVIDGNAHSLTIDIDSPAAPESPGNTFDSPKYIRPMN